MTESSSVLTFLTPEDHRRLDGVLRSAGRPAMGVNITVRREDGTAAATGEDGEICARGGNFMREYWRRPEETATAFVDGWYHTGDAGHVDEEGYVFLVDRIKDMIVSGGENVYSIEVENAISTHPGVAQVAVIGIPPCWASRCTPSSSSTQARHRGRTSASRPPATRGVRGAQVVEFRTDPLPLSGALKVLKRDLRRPYWDQSAEVSCVPLGQRASSTDGCSCQTCGPASSVRVRCRTPWSYCVEVTMPERLNTWIISRLSLSVSASNRLTPIWRAQSVR